MKKMLPLLLVISLCNCKTALKTAYGIKKPKLETEESVKQYLAKNEIDTSKVFVYKDILSFAKASEMNMMSFPEALFFNKDGYLVRYKKETEECNARVDEFLSDLKQFSKMPEDRSITTDKFFAMLAGDKPPKTDADITVVITWAVYVGRLNKEKAFEWVRLLEVAKTKGIKVNYILLNCDYQKSWNMPQQLIEKLGIKD